VGGGKCFGSGPPETILGGGQSGGKVIVEWVFSPDLRLSYLNQDVRKYGELLAEGNKRKDNGETWLPPEGGNYRGL